MAVELVIGGWFASAAISKLADAIRSYIESQYDYQRADIKGKLESLEENMTKIGAVMHEADQRHIENQSLKEWLLKLKDACYDAEDVVDMFEYQLLKDKANGNNQVRRLSKRACAVVKSFVFCNDELNDLLEIVDRFEKLAKEMKGLIPLLNSKTTNHEKVDKIMQERESISKPAESKLFGRDKERTRLKGLLLQTDVDSTKHVRFVSIVGTGGLGKTRLAQDVYNDPTLTSQFHLKAWVCVSNKFNVRRLVKDIIDSASIPKPPDFQNIESLETITEILKKGLIGKRFLIILDDIWDEPPLNWEVLLSVLNFGEERSKVVITTRILKLANMMKAESITLEGMQGEEYWKLFVNCAFGGESPEDYPDLEFVGKQIAEKLRGNPLAAKTVGAVLQRNLEADHWREILKNNLWEDDEINNGIMPVLKLSYDYLPAHLKPCFVYSSLFPKDYEYSENKLVRLWIAQGFIQPRGSKSMEKVGKVYFDELLSRCFFQRTCDVFYVMHDLLHDLAEHLSDSEFLRIEDCDLPEKNIPKRVRHAYINADNISLLCNNEYSKKHLRSLVVCGSREISPDILGQLKAIRMLILENRMVRLPSKSRMLHLRYLELYGEIKVEQTYSFPKWVAELYHLQVLLVYPESYGMVLSIPGIKLISLRHTPSAKFCWITEVERLTSLQELNFELSKNNPSYEIGKLRDLTQLTSLGIHGLESVETKTKASTAELHNKHSLEWLSLGWDYHCAGHHDEVLEGLKPHPNLKSLQLYNFGGRSPSWLDGNWLSNLSSIKLWRCTGWDALPPLGQLRLLRTLQLYQMEMLKTIGLEFYGCGGSGGRSNTAVVAFPSLESFHLSQMPELTEWCSSVEDFKLFPRLSYLAVTGCPKLRGPLYLPYPPTELHIEISSMECIHLRVGVHGKTFMDFTCPTFARLREWLPCRNLASVEDMTIECPPMEVLGLDQPTFLFVFRELFLHLTSLQSLHLTRLEYLHSLPSVLMNNKLHKLSVESCPQVWRLPEEGVPRSLKELEIADCSLLEERCKKAGPDWHKVAHVPKITINGEAIQML